MSNTTAYCAKIQKTEDISRDYSPAWEQAKQLEKISHELCMINERSMESEMVHSLDTIAQNLKELNASMAAIAQHLTKGQDVNN